MLSLDQILLFTGASLVLIFTPGPDILQVLTRGVTQGRGAALSAAAGFSLGNIVHTLFAVGGLSALLASSATAFQIVRYAGAAYLIYIGARLFLAPSIAHTADTDRPTQPLGLIFRQSVFANVLNPKVAIFFMAFFPQFVRADGGSQTVQMLALGGLFIVLTFLCFSAMAVACGRLNRWLSARPAVGGKLNKIAGSVLVGLGVSLALPQAR